MLVKSAALWDVPGTSGNTASLNPEVAYQDIGNAPDRGHDCQADNAPSHNALGFGSFLLISRICHEFYHPPEEDESGQYK